MNKKNLITVLLVIAIIVPYISISWQAHSWRKLAVSAIAQGERLLKLNRRSINTTKKCRQTLEVLAIRYGYITKEELEKADREVENEKDTDRTM